MLATAVSVPTYLGERSRGTVELAALLRTIAQMKLSRPVLKEAATMAVSQVLMQKMQLWCLSYPQDLSDFRSAPDPCGQAAIRPFRVHVQDPDEEGGEGAHQ
jgi:hypothetical protein